MPIKVTCQCGKSFAAKDELAGKAVKCPNCQQPLRIPGTPAPAAPPAAGIAAPLPSAATRQPATSASAFGPPPSAAASAHSLFDEVGLKQAPTGAQICPGCAAPLAPGAVVCVKCGFNLKLGRRMETVRMGADVGGPGGHSATAADLMARAAISIEEDKAEEKKKTREGMPWWVYLIGLCFAIGFIVMMMLLPQRIALLTGGIIMYGLAVGINFYAFVRIVMVAWSESPVQGLMVIFVPCYGLVYVFMHWDTCGGYFLMSVASDVVSNLVMYCIEAGLGGGGEEEGFIPKPPPAAAVARAGFDWERPPLLKGGVV
jgi:hypothetical protein